MPARWNPARSVTATRRGALATSSIWRTYRQMSFGGPANCSPLRFRRYGPLRRGGVSPAWLWTPTLLACATSFDESSSAAISGPVAGSTGLPRPWLAHGRWWACSIDRETMGRDHERLRGHGHPQSAKAPAGGYQQRPHADAP